MDGQKRCLRELFFYASDIKKESLFSSLFGTSSCRNLLKRLA